MLGIIIDVRHNGGGNLNNGNRLAACFVDSSTVYAYQRYKTGPGPDDFTSWGEMTISPREGERFGGPVVLLTNRRSYSASTFFAQMMRAIPRATVMGDHTGGGGGIPLFGELPNGWRYRFSATQTITPEGEHIEHEVPVDIRAEIEPGDEARGVDSIIEKALFYIRNGALPPAGNRIQPAR
jgi:C-terminal processing protease CtpA/Prc